MARSERMRAVLTLAERAEQQAASALKSCREQLVLEQEQLSQLQTYRGQYLQQYQSRRSGLHASEMISYSGFIQRLALVLAEQEKKLVQIQNNYTRLQEYWQREYHRRQSVERLIERLKREENASLERRLQQELDELAAQQHWRGRDS